MNTFLNNLKSLAFGLIVLLFAAGMTLSACSGQQSGEATETEEVEQEATESSEHPSDDAAEEGEHPSDDAEEESEHPSDSTASEEGEHPDNG